MTDSLFTPQGTPSILSSPYKELPILVMKGKPQEVTDLRIYCRNVDGSASRVCWNNSQSVNEAFEWVEGGDLKGVLPVPFGFYIWNAAPEKFSILSTIGWSFAAAKLIEMRKADLLQENLYQEIVSSVKAAAKKIKAKSKPTSNPQQSVTPEMPQDTIARSKFF